MSKTLGYILAIIGIIAIALTFDAVTKLIKITLPASINNSYLMIGGIIILILGLLIIGGGKKSVKSKGTEVPIYQGNQVIGYRRA